MKIIGIVVTRNRYDSLITSLASVFKEGERWLSGVIVVDNGSSDQTASLTDEVDKIKVIHLPYNLGLERGIAVGIQCAMRFDVDGILLFDDDSIFLPNSISSLVESFLLYKKEAAISTLPLSDLNGELSSPRLIGSKMLTTKQELLAANNGRRHICTMKLHFNGCLIGKEWLEKIPFTGMLGEEAYGALLHRKGCLLIIDIDANILHPSIKRYETKLLNLPFGKQIMVWHLPPWKAYQAARESVVKRAILCSTFRFFTLDLPGVVGIYLIRIIFEEQRIVKLPFYFKGLLDGVKIAISLKQLG